MTMLLIDNKNISDPRINLALEEYCFRNLNTYNYLLFYINQPSIIFGRHQNLFQEINLELVNQKNILLVRRISGGGTVYHDFGNLNFSFITDFTEDKLDYFKTLIGPIIKAIEQLGVSADLTEKNTLVVCGKKISGSSQHTNMRRLLSHGTLLFHSDLNLLQSVLESNLKIIQSKGIASIKSDVTNISEHLLQPMDLKTFLTKLTSAISDEFGGLKEFQLTSVDWEAVYKLAKEKYTSWEWTFGRSPEFSVRHKFKSDSGDIHVDLNVKHGIIENIKMQKANRLTPPIRKVIEESIGKRYGSDFTGGSSALKRLSE
jgi:lipoate-protein ligase A